ncbi:MAG: S9 family peptidase [Candidatus Aminicenantaceae bacterium]
MHKGISSTKRIMIASAAMCMVVFLVGTTGCTKAEKSTVPEAPLAKKVPKELTIHGDTRIDEYFWLNQREDPEVIAYLEAENAYTTTALKHTEPLQDKLFTEIVGRIDQTDMSVPYKDNGYFYYTRYEEGDEYPYHCRKKGSLEAEEEVLLNVNTMAEGQDYFSVSGVTVSPDNTLLAYGVDTVSRRKYTIHFMDLRTGEMFADAILNTTGRAVWANDNRTVFYARKDEALRPFKIFRHLLGTDAGNDPEIFHEADNTYNTYVSKTKSQKYLVIASSSTDSSEYRLLDADTPDGSFQVFHPREADLLYSLDHFQDYFYIRTNLDALNFRLMKTPLNKTGKDNWSEVIPHREDVLFQGFELFREYLVLSEVKAGITDIRVIRWDDGSEHYLDFGEAAYMARPSTNREFDTGLLRYSYTSLTTPSSVYDYDMQTREKTLLKRQEVLGGFESENYQAERLFATAGDGTQVPISLVYRKGFVRDGSSPLLLYGYGSYGSSMYPTFRPDRLSLIDRGFVYAIAHIRGGQEMGRSWYEDGKLLNKKNTFTDFIDCAEFLIDERYAAPDRVFAMGGSAGGLLMGAVINMRPDLWKGVIAGVPWVDVITTMLDESIPLTAGEWSEWGDPREKEYYDYMLSYSPYDQVKAQDYPALLVTTGLHDSQVQYWEPAKWVARIRALKTDDNLLVLHTNMEAGHGGQSGRFRRYRETALEYAFILDLLGIED